jgi:S-adenosylmethionine:tRNA ribosyltransferase-isomerase
MTEISSGVHPKFIEELSLSDYQYTLPNDRIAQFPLAARDRSKLLVAKADTNDIHHFQFQDLPDLIPPTSMLVRNNTRVIMARLYLQKITGGKVEVLCVEPSSPSPEPAVALYAKGSCQWRCIIGGRKIVAGMTLRCAALHAQEPLYLNAKIVEKHGSEATVEFSWSPERLTFATILETIGQMPLPPYMKRGAEESDKERYQTVYASQSGSVAAPTAGLHFTDKVLESLSQKKIPIQELTLHVGLGTFKPVESDRIAEHAMHTERVVIACETVRAIALHFEINTLTKPYLIAVGTTSLRTLESLYWFGVKLWRAEGSTREKKHLWLDQWESYRLSADELALPSPMESLNAVIQWAEHHQLNEIKGETKMIIVPGYEYKLCNGLITNFHQPQSTLILLVAAFVGKKLWRHIYDTALRSDYRFLSYGDSSLLLK